MEEPVIIRFEHISKSYGEFCVLHDFNLEVMRGEFLTVIGSSGSGKTTVLKMVNGLIIPDGGKLFVDGQDISGTNLIELRRKIGYVIQNIGLFPHMTVWKNIAYVPSLLNKQDKERTKKAVARLMDVVGLSGDLMRRYPSELSGGQQQRVGIARALASNPYILLMDEPFGAVDEITRKMLQEEISRIHKALNVTTIFVTHDIREPLKLGTRVLVMDAGRIEQLGDPDEIIHHPATDFVARLTQSRGLE